MSHIKNFTTYERFWFLSFYLLGTILFLFSGTSFLSLISLYIGMLCVIFAAKGKKVAYFFGSCSDLLYAYICYKNGLFGNFTINLLYELPLRIIGFHFWSKSENDDGTVKSRSLNNFQIIIFSLIFILSVFVYGSVLNILKTQNIPYIDALTNVLSISASILLFFRFKESWFLFIFLDLSSILMWIFRFLNGSNDASLMIIMWTAYLMNAIYGYILWTKNGSHSEIDTVIP